MAQTITNNNALAQSDNHLLPDFCNSRTVLLVIVVAELLAIVLSLSVHRFHSSFFVNLAYTSLFIQSVALIDAAMICFFRRYSNQLSHMQMILLVYICMQLITLMITFLSHRVLQSYEFSGSALNEGWLLYGPNLLISIIISALIMRYFYVQNQWQEKQQTETASRIAALQARIRPHFLFNSMNTIANLVYEDPQKAENAVLDLADLYRATLAEPEMVSLDQEIKHANGYLRIEQVRLGERLQLDFTVEDDCKGLMMPSMILQPLVENAVYHGIESVSTGGKLEVIAYQAEQKLNIKIRNPLPDSPRERHHAGNHMAINNIKQRLQLTFGKKAFLESSQDKKHYTVHLCIPIKLNPVTL